MTIYTYKFNPVNLSSIPGNIGQIGYPIQFLVQIEIEAQYKTDADAYMASIGFYPV